MRFVNLTQLPLAFEICGQAFAVPVLDEVEIPEKLALSVKLHGIPLTPLTDAEPEAPKPVKKK